MHSGGGSYPNMSSIPRAVSMMDSIKAVEYKQAGYTGFGITMPSVLLSRYLQWLGDKGQLDT